MTGEALFTLFFIAVIAAFICFGCTVERDGDL